MPKRAWRRNSQVSANAEEIDEPGHTPKWTRSSPSLSPESYSMADTQSVKDETTNTQEMQCILPGHPPLILASVAEFESHYARDHTNQCIACKANLPSPWMLELHHQENHDPLIAARRDSGEKTYQCFLQDCEKVTLTAQKRRLHLIDKHGFARNYHFALIDSGLKGRGSLLQETKDPAKKSKRGANTNTPTGKDKVPDTSNQQTDIDLQDVSYSGQVQKDVQELGASSSKLASVLTKQQDRPLSQEKDAAVDKLSNAMSSLMFVPMSVRRKNTKNG